MLINYQQMITWEVRTVTTEIFFMHLKTVYNFVILRILIVPLLFRHLLQALFLTILNAIDYLNEQLFHHFGKYFPCWGQARRIGMS